MKPECSSPCSHQHTTCLYPDSAHSSSHNPRFFFQLNLNTILPSTPRSSKWCLSLKSSPPKPCVYFSLPPYVPNTKPLRSHLLGHPNNILIGIRTTMLLFVNFSPFCCFVPLLKPKCIIFSARCFSVCFFGSLYCVEFCIFVLFGI